MFILILLSLPCRSLIPFLFVVDADSLFIEEAFAIWKQKYSQVWYAAVVDWLTDWMVGEYDSLIDWFIDSLLARMTTKSRFIIIHIMYAFVFCCHLLAIAPILTYH